MMRASAGVACTAKPVKDRRRAGDGLSFIATYSWLANCCVSNVRSASSAQVE